MTEARSAEATSGTRAPPPRTTGGPYDSYLFLALSCAITWALDFPMAHACVTHTAPPPYALPMAGLGALGPTLAALVLGLYRKDVRSTFARWRAPPVWILVALLLPAAIHLPATLIEVALGGRPERWFYYPNKPEFVAAMVVFSVGEELGWRGFAYPRLVARHGLVIGNLILGAVWGLWHLGMLFTPERGAPTILGVLRYMVQLALWSLVVAWVFERGNRSMAVAIAVHAGGHLDNTDKIPESEARLRLLHFLVLVIASTFAARALAARSSKQPVAPEPSRGMGPA